MADSHTSPARWKDQQRELLRAAFAPAFVKYTELVNKVHDPDDWRKYLDFIARQVGLEEPTFKAGPNDALTLVNINIGSFAVAARPMQAVPTTKPALDVQQVQDVEVVEPVALVPPPEELPIDVAGALDDILPMEMCEADVEQLLDAVLPVIP